MNRRVAADSGANREHLHDDAMHFVESPNRNYSKLLDASAQGKSVLHCASGHAGQDPLQAPHISYSGA
jgi:hypothetical protein